ncbi:MAG: beta-lactamase family protein [Alphaproteobacteria bacterium]|nr:beta-lactamase family protein [Alphaproteobacteria bacterium]MBU2270653.1 beta-lactamase family protein [Alphaproteobacteria bacterium]MBU2419090.1 beta-lactamase family protein [Alphaproteobacteria bacterium]
MRLIFLSAALGLVVALTPFTGAHASSQDTQAGAVADLLLSVAELDEPGLAAAVLLDGTVVASAVAGQADLEQGVAVTPATVFHAASLSKQFTAFAILLLEQDGKLSIDDSVSAYLPETARWPPITLRRLMNHTNGLRDLGALLTMAGWRSEDLVTNQQALDLILAQDGLNFEPGAAFQYNNSDYVLLAEVVRRVSGQSLTDFCQARIFGPLGMAHTRFQNNLAAIEPGRAQSYAPAGEGFSRQILNFAYTGPTGLQTTAEDLVRWAANFETGDVGGPALFRRMEIIGRLNDGSESFYPYASGQEHHVYKERSVWSHGGRDAGFRSFLLRVPGERLAISVLSNRSDIDASDIAYRIADIYLASGASAAPLAEAIQNPTSDDLAAYAGDFELFPGLILNFISDGDRLLFSMGGQASVPVPALTRRSFELDARTGLSVVFDPVASGKSPGLKYMIGLNGALSAARVELAPFSPDAVRPQDYVGRYHSAELSTDYVFKVIEGELVAHHPRWSTIPMHGYQPDTFSGGGGVLSRVRFVRDEGGRVTGFDLSGPVAEGIAFRRQADRPTN